MLSMKKEHKDMFFYGQPPIPTNSALRGYSHKQPLCACGVAGLRKNISLYSFLLILFLFLDTKVFASVAGEVNKANDLYKQGKYDDSLGLYQAALDKDEQSPVVKYDLGTALYKKGDYVKALDYLEQASRDKNVKIKTKAEYNLGNVLYKTGMQKANTNVDQAINSLQEALSHYNHVIADLPQDQDAVYNQDFVKKEIERLKQKKQEQKQNKQQNQKQQQQNQKNQQNKQGQENKEQNQQSQQGKAQDQKDQSSQSANQKQKQEQQSSAKRQENKQPQTQESQKEIDRKQAEDLLEDYQENEEPKKLLNYMPKKIDDRPVLKDW